MNVGKKIIIIRSDAKSHYVDFSHCHRMSVACIKKVKDTRREASRGQILACFWVFKGLECPAVVPTAESNRKHSHWTLIYNVDIKIKNREEKNYNIHVHVK